MEGKRILILIVSGLIAVVLVCVLLAGIIDGQWPWENDNDHPDYTGIAATTAETTEETEDTTADTIEATDETTDGTKETEETQKPTQKPDNGASTDFDVEIKDEDDDEDGDYGVIDFDDLLAGKFPTNATTKPTESTATKPTTKPGGTTQSSTTEPTTKPSDTTQSTTKPTQAGLGIEDDDDLTYEFD